MGKIGDVYEIPGEIKYEWTINGFSRLSSEPDIRYESPTYCFSGASWENRIYLNGETKNGSEGWISLYVARMSSGFPITVDYTFSLKTARGKAYTRSYTNVIDKKNTGWGISKFMLRSMLMEKMSKLVPSDVLTIICTLRNSEPSNVADSIYSRHQDICDNLRGMYEEAKRSDLKLKLNGEGNIYAHQLILATRSPEFASLLGDDTTENLTGEVSIEDTDRNTMHNLLLHIYCGDIDSLTKQNALSLFSAASKYGIKYIEEICFEFIIRNLSVEWVCDVIKFAELNNEEELNVRARRYFKENANKIIKSENWKTFEKDNLYLSTQLLQSLVKGLLQQQRPAEMDECLFK